MNAKSPKVGNKPFAEKLLKDIEIKRAKPKDKEYRLRDGNGLFVIVKPNNSKLFQIELKRGDIKLKTTIGRYPEISLQKARTKRDNYLSLMSEGIHPLKQKEDIAKAKEIESKSQLHLVVREWVNILQVSEGHKKRIYRMFERDLFPFFGTYSQDRELISTKPVKEIDRDSLLIALKQKELTAPETAQRLFVDCNRLWNYAIFKEYTDINITAKILKSELAQPTPRHYSKITDLPTLKELLLKIDSYHGQPITRHMLRLLCIIPLRAENLTTLRWDMIDFEAKMLTIPRQEMKVKNSQLPDFKIILPHQALKILKEVYTLTGWGKWVFHGLGRFHNPISKESGNKALRLLGFDGKKYPKQTQHSFRGTFRSLCETYHAEHKATFETMERALDHHERSQVVRAYAHKADYSKQIGELLQWWSDFLDCIKEDEVKS